MTPYLIALAFVLLFVFVPLDEDLSAHGDVPEKIRNLE